VARGTGDGAGGEHATQGRQLTTGNLTGMLTYAAAAGDLTGARTAFTEEPGADEQPVLLSPHARKRAESATGDGPCHHRWPVRGALSSKPRPLSAT
jgi:hypothetical protein